VLGGLVLIAVVIGLLVIFTIAKLRTTRRSMTHHADSLQDLRPRCRVLVTDNQPVKAGQILVRIDPRDYQASLDQARAAVALPRAMRLGGSGRPGTRENVASGTSSADAQLAGP